MTTNTDVATMEWGPGLTVQASPNVERVIFIRKDGGGTLALVPLSMHRDETIRRAEPLFQPGEREQFIAGLEALVDATA